MLTDLQRKWIHVGALEKQQKLSDIRGEYLIFANRQSITAFTFGRGLTDLSLNEIGCTRVYVYEQNVEKRNRRQEKT